MAAKWARAAGVSVASVRLSDPVVPPTPYMYRVSEDAPVWAGLAVLGIFGVLPPLALYHATVLFED